MTHEEALKEALKIKPTYPNDGFCGCGEGWWNECCQKLEKLIDDEECHCIYDEVKKEVK